MRRYMRQPSVQMAWGGVGLLLLIVGGPIGLRAATGPAAKGPAPVPRKRPRPGPGAAAVPQPPVSAEGITLEDGLLSVNVRQHDLRTLIANIATQGDIEVRHAAGIGEQRVSLRFDALPLVEGLKRLFRAAALSGYALVTDNESGQTTVRRILFLPVREGGRGWRPSSRSRRRPAPRRTREGRSGNGTVFDDIKRNTTARRLLSQLGHPNERVRERALERLLRLVPDDDKQAALLEYLEPRMEQLASEYKEDRAEARADIRQLLRR
jgi:hypothetical protein